MENGVVVWMLVGVDDQRFSEDDIGNDEKGRTVPKQTFKTSSSERVTVLAP